MLACNPCILAKAEHDRDVKGAVEEVAEVKRLIKPSQFAESAPLHTLHFSL